jgi:WD40 repeat protein
VCLWDLSTGIRLLKYIIDEKNINKNTVFSFGDYPNKLITASDKGEIILSDLSTGNILAKLNVNESLNNCAVTPDGLKVILTGTTEMHILKLEGLEKLKN